MQSIKNDEYRKMKLEIRRKNKNVIELVPIFRVKFLAARAIIAREQVVPHKISLLRAFIRQISTENFTRLRQNQDASLLVSKRRQVAAVG